MRRHEGILAPDERRRAAAFFFDRHRAQFIVARGLLRRILGRYLGVEPGDLRFRCNAYGRPALVAAPGEATPSFNVSRSHGLALYAVALGRAVGVDVEWIRADLPLEQMAEQFCSPRELAVLRALPPHARPEAFFRCWTRKEAYVKARGEGLSVPLRGVDVSSSPGDPAAVADTPRPAPEGSARWFLRNLAPGPGYVAAVAAEGHDWTLACWDGSPGTDLESARTFDAQDGGGSLGGPSR